MSFQLEFSVHAKFDPPTIVMVQPVLVKAGEPSNFTTPDLTRARKVARDWADQLCCGVVDTCEPSA